MKPRILAVFCVLAAALQPLAESNAQLIFAQSTFDTDADGWQSVTLPYPSAVPPTVLGTFAPQWVAGYITIADPDGSGPVGNTEYWQAPAKFLGDQSLAYHGSLEFDLANSGSSFGTFYQEDVILLGGGLTLVHDLGTAPGASFSHYVTPLLEGAWYRDGLTGPVATRDELVIALGSITQLFIRAEFQLGPDVEYLDNVTLGIATSSVGGSARALALELAPPAPNPSRGGVRADFVLPRDGQADVSVFDANGRRIATLVRGVLSAGTHAAAWDGNDGGGRPARAGLYWLRLAAGAQQVTRKIVRSE